MSSAKLFAPHAVEAVTTYAMIGQVAAVVFGGLFLRADVKRGECEGDVRFQMDSPVMFSLFQVIRFGLLLCLYGGMVTVLYSVQDMKHPGGADLTPPLSPAMRNVMILTKG